MRCDVCGTRKIVRNSYEGACIPCRKWFAEIKTNLFKVNPKLWYKIREKGLL